MMIKLLSLSAVSLPATFSDQRASLCSVLTHEAIIDSTWDRGIKPLLPKRFPAAVDDELIQAHAYEYGGRTIQDLGYNTATGPSSR